MAAGIGSVSSTRLLPGRSWMTLANQELSRRSISGDRLQSETIPSLNGIRAISVLIVVLSHAGLGNIVPGGLGVTIFFFLSGYLITTLMLAEYESSGGIDILSFYARRILRLIPPLLITLTIAYALVYIGFLPGTIELKALVAQLMYFANYYAIYFDPGNRIPAGTGILWSLAVEEHFYIVYPFVMSLCLTRGLRPRTIGIAFAIICIVILGWRVFLVGSGVSEYRTYYGSDTRIDSIVYGCLLSVCMNPMGRISPVEKMSAIQWMIFAASSLLLLSTLIYRDDTFRETFRYSAQGLSLLPIFYFTIRYHDNKIFRYLNLKWVIALGIYSYSIYLIHYVIINCLIMQAPVVSKDVWALFAAAFILSIAYASLIDRFVDPYFRGLRRHYRPRIGDLRNAELASTRKS